MLRRYSGLGFEIVLDFLGQLVGQDSMEKLSLFLFQFLFYELVLGGFSYVKVLSDFVFLNLNLAKDTSFRS
jgi:hypothetical protein